MPVISNNVTFNTKLLVPNSLSVVFTKFCEYWYQFLWLLVPIFVEFGIQICVHWYEYVGAKFCGYRHQLLVQNYCCKFWCLGTMNMAYWYQPLDSSIIFYDFWYCISMDASIELCEYWHQENLGDFDTKFCNCYFWIL